MIGIDRKQIGETFLRESDALYRYALRMTGSAQNAEEAVSRAALRCLEKGDQFAGNSKLRTWLFGVLHNVIREMRREDWREEPLGDENYPPDHMFDHTGHATAAGIDLGDNPEAVLVRQESLDRILEELNGLPPLQRSAFHLRYIEEWEPEEIRNALGVTDTHLRVLLHRARLHLRDRLAGRSKSPPKS